MSQWESDLVVLVPDRHMEAAVRGLLSRPEALSIRALRLDVYVHMHRDPGCFTDAHGFLGLFTNRYAHGLVLFDRVGCGQEGRPREELEETVTDRLARSGWGDRAGVIVLDPELEVWVWSDSPHVDRCLGWKDRQPNLRSWLHQQDHWQKGAHKPADPKTAMESAMRLVRKQRSSSIYAELAQNVSFQKCSDPAFLKLKKLLMHWFAKDSVL